MRSESCQKEFRPYAKRGLYERFQKSLVSLEISSRKKPVLLGLSGGRDSVTLLHLLLVCKIPVIAAHLNHCLRGRESDADERFVRQVCKAWGVPLVVKREKVMARMKRHKLSKEEAARIARYRFLEQVARQRHLGSVLVAHHQKDQAETILLKIFHGCERQHLCGMRIKRPFPILNWIKSTSRKNDRKLELVRPLLQASIEEIALYARQNKLKFSEDSSNQDLSHPRNWIRKKLLPLIERRLNRNVVKTLARLGGN
jgi:tRNA(Ile)-lysidine synthase